MITQHYGCCCIYLQSEFCRQRYPEKIWMWKWPGTRRKKYIWYKRVHQQRPVGLVVWFSLRVREVPGSTPGQALFLPSSEWIYKYGIKSRGHTGSSSSNETEKGPRDLSILVFIIKCVALSGLYFHIIISRILPLAPSKWDFNTN